MLITPIPTECRVCVCRGMVDVRTRTREDPCMGRRSAPSVGRLTVLREVGVVRLQDAWSDRSFKET